MKYTATWWVGWIVLFPFRLFFTLVGAFLFAFSPTAWDKFQFAIKDDV